MNIRINKLRIRNFMGIKELDLDFNGADAVIRGDNGTGKTTVKSAFSWLLFDKNTFGKSDFNIKPLNPLGQVVHHLETSVEAELCIDDEVKILKKTFTEKWTRKRGAAEATFSGNENGYFINNIPQKKSEYNAVISKLIDDKVFKAVTDPLFFNEQMDWKARRVVLMDICGDISDAEILASDENLAPLKEIISNRTVDEHKMLAKAKMKSINGELDMIPAKINEAELAKPNIGSLEVNVDKKEKLLNVISELQEKKSGIINGTEKMKLNAERNELIRTLENLALKNPDITAEELQLKGLMSSLSETRREIEENLNKQKCAKDLLKQHKEKKAGLSKDWDKTHSLRFTDDICPVCNQPLPAEKLEERRKEFNIERAATLDGIEKTLFEIKSDEKRIREELEGREEIIHALGEGEKTLHRKCVEINAAIEEMKEEHENFIATERRTLRARIESIDIDLHNIENGNVDKIKQVSEEISLYQKEVAEIDEYFASLKMIEKQDARIEELRKQQVELSQEYIKHERELYLCEQFTRKKVDMLNEKINSNFKYAKFKLFDIQVNGGIVETCEVTFNGVPYSDLNNAAKINVGIDVINTLCRKNEVNAPIFIDNAESIVQILTTESQQIRLVVDEKYKSLTKM